MEIQRIRSVLFLWQKVCLLLSILLLIACGILFIPGRHSHTAYIDRFDVPGWYYGLGYVAFFVSICFVFYLSIAKWYKRDMLRFTESHLIYKDKEFFVNEMEDIVLLRHPLKYKPKENRNLFNGGGNNWLNFKCHSKKYSIEYFLPSKKEEEELNLIFQKWELVADIKHGVAEEQEFLGLFDDLSFKSKYDEFKFS